MRRAATIWGSALGALLAYDVLCDRRKDNSTLSCVVRATFRTDTTPGRAFVIGGWAALTAWLLPHLCRVVRDVTTDQ